MKLYYLPRSRIEPVTLNSSVTNHYTNPPTPQVENEYGSYGSDHAYMNAMRALLHSHVGDQALLYTTDGFSRNFFTRGYADGALTTVDFGVSK